MRIFLTTGLLLTLCAALCAQEKKRPAGWIPNQATLQFAGSIGLMSLGVGYTNSHDNLNLQVGYGYVPESAGGRLDILHAKLLYKPFTVKLGSFTLWRPLNPGGFISYTLNEGFYGKWPEHQYPKDYYWWNSAMRLHASISSEISLGTLPSNRLVKSYAFYVEANTNDLYIASFLTNRSYLSVWDILKLGAGVKINLNH